MNYCPNCGHNLNLWPTPKPNPLPGYPYNPGPYWLSATCLTNEMTPTKELESLFSKESTSKQ